MKVAIEETDLIEITQSDLRVDKEAGVIRGVKILGRTSKNGRTYPDRTMRAATGLYEGLGAFVNHPPRSAPDTERRVEDRVGWFEAVHVTSDGMYGDLHVLTTHSMAGPLFEAAQRNPRLIGLSHNAAGRERRDGKTHLVEEIQRVRSVDIVTAPATTRGLFESSQEPNSNMEHENMSKPLKEIIKTLDKEDPATKLLEQMVDEVPAVAEAPVEDGADAMKAAFRAAIVAAFDDESLDTKATMKKIGDVLKAYEKLTAKDEPEEPADEEPAPEDEETPESVDPELAAKVAKLEGRDKARTLLDDAGIVPDDAKHREAMLESLAAVSEENQKTLIETWKKATPAQRPRSGGSLLRESQDPPKRSGKEFAQTFLK